MRAMASEVPSPRRPNALWFAGFACVALGAVIAGVGATREWAAVGFAAVAALLVLLAMRTSGSAATRRGLAIVLIVLGALCVALPILDAVRAEDRFGGVGGVDRLARAIAVELEIPVEVVLELLSELLEQDLRVEIQPGLWLTAFGGVLLVAGGILGFAWVRGGTGTEGRGVEAV